MSATAVPTPDWLKNRNGVLKPGIRDGVVYVMLGGQPQYRLDIRPAKGAFSCAVLQTINGKSIGDGSTYPTTDAALSGGLDQLRNALGW